MAYRDLEKRKEWLRAWQAANRDKIKAYNRVWHEINKERIKAKGLKWREANKEKIASYGRKYYEINKKKILARNSKWKKDNSEKYKTIQARCSKDWYQRNRERVGFTTARWQQENKERCRSNARKWAKDNPGKVIARVVRYQTRKFNATPPWLTKEHLQQIEAFYTEAARLSKETGIKYSVDHIWPLRGKGFTGLHVPWNLRVIPFSENRKKCNKVPCGDIKCL
jgi:hypothetical protein